MAFPPRPPLMSGVPMVGTPFTIATVRIPTMSQALSTIPTPLTNRPQIRHMMPSNVPMPRPPLPPNAIINKPPTFSQRIESLGPAVTVFVGNITERAPDIMIRHILNACGPVLSWKRVQGASGKLQGFGFCEYGNPDAALRAIRMLHGFDIATNKLVVKADSKTTEVLDDYKEKRKKAHNGNNENSSPLQDEKKEESEPDDYIDDDMKAEDRNCIERIAMILCDHKKEIINYIPPQNRQDVRDKRMNKVQEKLVALSSGADIAGIPSSLNLDDMDDVEEGKRELISREITQFREQMKKQEEEKERDRKIREKDRERDRERDSERSKERERDRERERERERDKERERREREERSERRRKSRSPPSRSASIIRKSSRSPSTDVRYSRKEKHQSRSRSRSPASRKSDKEILKDRERDAEEKEKKEQERKVRKKEMQYQERLKNWEAREHKKQKELDRECDKEKIRESEREREARRLKEFLEDYDDERDDHKYYKGHNFQRKLLDRDHEKEVDTKDRVKEKEELEELKAKILSEGHENPEEAYEQARQEREEQYRPKLLLKPAEKPAPPSEPVSRPSSPPEIIIEKIPSPQTPASETNNKEESDSEPDSPHSDGPPEPLPQEDENSLSRDAFSSAETTPQAPKRKKFDVKDVFNQDDDEAPVKKKKLPLPGKEKASKEKGGEEKRKHIKSLIDKIPTSKSELFAYPIDASLVDTGLMEKRIRPWINKKIIEYIGEPEPTLVDFICTKVLVGSEPQSLLNDVQMVLDDEAEVFVVKMWRLLIYEIEAKKMGLGKT